MALLITDECINCDVCEPAQMKPSPKAMIFMSLIQIYAPNVLGILMSRNAW